MSISTYTKVCRTTLLVTSLAITTTLGAQGLSYDMSTTASGPDRSGNVTTRNMSAAHGQFAGGNSRIDFIESLAPSGMMSTGTYMITSASKHTVTSVDPAKHQYTVIDLAELGKTATDMSASLGGGAKTEFTNVKVAVEDLGPGEALDGYATYKYRIAQSFTMNISAMGRTISAPSQSTTEIWIAPQLDALMDPSAQPHAMSTGPMAELTKELIAAYGKMRRGLMLKRVSTTEGGMGAHKHTTTMTTVITNVRKAAISSSVFEVPAGYAKVALLDAESEAGAPPHPKRPE
jgi:hypothetical protein